MTKIDTRCFCRWNGETYCNSMTSGVPKFARNSAAIHKAVINSVHVIVAPDLMSQVAIRNCCYVAQWFRTKIFHCPISSGSKDGASKRKSDVVHFVVVFSGLVVFPTKTLCFGYKRIHYLMMLMRSIKKTQLKFLLRYELGMEESKADKDRFRCSSERRIFWALSVQKLWKISWDMSNLKWSTWKRQFLCWIHWVDNLYNFESKWNKCVA